MPEKTVATTQAIPDPPPLFSTNQYEGPVSWVINAAVAFMVAVFWLRRKAHRDNTEITKDKAESNLVQTLREERDRAMREAREAWARRTADAERIAELATKNEYLERDVQALKHQVSDLTLRLDLALSTLSTLKPDFQLPPHLPSPSNA